MFDVQQTARDILAKDYFGLRNEPTTPVPKAKCNLQVDCPADHFALRIRSGAANVVGPSICFDGQIIMAHLKNNVGPGLNIVVINGETGDVDKFGYLNTRDGRQEDIVEYLKKIEPGRIVLLASYDDVAPKMTDEMRDILAGMGSTLIKTVKSKDSWVFAGRAATGEKSLFEKMAVNDPKTNAYDGWPEVVEINGCLPRKSGLTDTKP